MSISHPLQADEDGHHIILKVRTGLATTLLLDDPTILLFYFNTLRCILLVSGHDMSISYPGRKDGDGHNFLFQNENGIGQHLILRFEMATTSLSNEKGVNHLVFLR